MPGPLERPCLLSRILNLRNGPNTVSGSTVSNTELSEFLGLIEFRGAMAS